ncbi:hypothetical protein [Deinococcus sp.]|uniref:hypothetical protein n=1 Tax=Deinococcus sp. TaxID=47478 RepID=UPI003B5A63D6
MIDIFATLGIERSGLIMLDAQNALIIIDKLEETGIDILGIDAFKITPESTQPIMEQDFNLISQHGSSWGATRRHIIDRRSLGLHFEFVLSD